MADHPITTKPQLKKLLVVDLKQRLTALDLPINGEYNLLHWKLFYFHESDN